MPEQRVTLLTVDLPFCCALILVKPWHLDISSSVPHGAMFLFSRNGFDAIAESMLMMDTLTG